MSEEEWLADFIKQLGPEALMRAADNELDYARVRFKRSVERLFEREVARIAKLIEEPGRYSVREWEKVRTYFEWIARRRSGSEMSGLGAISWRSVSRRSSFSRLHRRATRLWNDR